MMYWLIARLPNSLSHQNDQQSRKNNVIVYGLPECTINLSRLQRIKKDLDETTHFSIKLTLISVDHLSESAFNWVDTRVT